MHSAADLAFMRQTQTDALPGTAIIQAYTYVGDGQGGSYEAYAGIGTVAARLYPQTTRSFSESVSGGQIISLTSWFITMPWDTVVDSRNRISMEGRTWEVASVNNDENWRTAIRCEVSSKNEESRT